jgi:hypothetical protein
MKLSIKQIVSLDQSTNIMTTNIYLSAYWYDLRFEINKIFLKFLK